MADRTAGTLSAAALIARLALEPHPEGGWFKRIHTSGEVIETPNGPRAGVTSIHYLLSADEPIGRLHRNRSDILHYWQGGGAIEYLLLDEEAGVSRVVLGPEPDQQLFLFVAGGTWKASRLVSNADYGLISEAVVPGFDYADHEFASQALLERWPQHRHILLPLIRDQAKSGSDTDFPADSPDII